MTLDFESISTDAHMKEEEEEEYDEEELMDEEFDEEEEIEEDASEELENSDSSSSLVAGSPHGSSSGSNSSHSPSLQDSPSHGSSGSSPSQGSNAPEKRHICSICNKGFSYFSILESHKRSHTGEKPYKCHYNCPKRFAQKATLQVHERTHTGERPYKCRYCPKTFAQYGTKTVHEKSAHLGIRNYKCPKCGKLLSSPSALYTHKKTHGDKIFRCEFCPKTFALKNYLKLHVKQVHEQNERKHICVHCDKGFAYAGSLQVHVRTHTGERPYICKFCPKSFASQGNLQSHERTHTGERPYSCQFCPRTFIQKSQLTAHEATHLTNKQANSESNILQPAAPEQTGSYECTLCHKKYPYASSLYIHMRKHSGDSKPGFSCEGCGKPYNQKTSLSIHQDQCDAFKNWLKLDKMRIESAENVTSFPHNCEGCGTSCVQPISLRIHLDQCEAYKNLIRMRMAIQNQNLNPLLNSDSESDTEMKICPLPNPPLTLPNHQIPPPVNIYAQQAPVTSFGSILGSATLTPSSLGFSLPPLTSSQNVFNSLNAHAPYTSVELAKSADFGPLAASKPPPSIQPSEAISAFHTPARKIPESPTSSLLSTTPGSLGSLSSSILSTQLLLQQFQSPDFNYLLNTNLLSSLAAGLNLPTPQTPSSSQPSFLLAPNPNVVTVQSIV
ncbi:hypothetical protein L3Y34_005715 [Caenorhabditis briggsae]|uniref:C2H2-type domain-containing protein n=1 Tax=Caenorhabditis briggsae TaxID=6238 RepID=A0AAE9D7T5_CAEBR|nr:hypothetical protein L3Y34_005715 [Caenorhabditis briggsae]